MDFFHLSFLMDKGCQNSYFFIIVTFPKVVTSFIQLNNSEKYKAVLVSV